MESQKHFKDAMASLEVQTKKMSGQMAIKERTFSELIFSKQVLTSQLRILEANYKNTLKAIEYLEKSSNLLRSRSQPQMEFLPSLIQPFSGSSSEEV